jgi:hypothetical protein
MKHVATVLLVLLVLPSASRAQQAIRSLEMIANGGGAVPSTVGFDVTAPPSGYDAYSADWYRDVLQSTGEQYAPILGLDGGMQEADGWFFIVAMPPGVSNDGWAQNQWSRNGALNHVLDGNSYEIRFTELGG